MYHPALSDFPAGAAFAVESNSAKLQLVVLKAHELPGSVREGGGFRIEFLGPPQPVLPQSIYRFECDGQAFEIFIVPIAEVSEGIGYEAIFL